MTNWLGVGSLRVGAPRLHLPIMSEEEAYSHEQRPPLTWALVAHRIAAGCLVFLLPVLIGMLIMTTLGNLTGGWYTTFVLGFHPFAVLFAITAVTQWNTRRFKISLAFHVVWHILSLALALLVAINVGIGTEYTYYCEPCVTYTERLGIPVLIFWSLLHLICIITGFQILKEPVRGPTPEATVHISRDGALQYNFAIDWAEDTDDGLGPGPKTDATANTGLENAVELSNLDNLDDGLSAPSLHQAHSTPTGLARYLPNVIQTISILVCVIWPFYFLDVIFGFILMSSFSSSYNGEAPNAEAVFCGLTVIYHYAMLIWLCGAVTVSFGYKERRRLFAASITTFVYIVICIAIIAVKFGIWPRDFFSPILGVIHLVLVAIWCAASYRLATNQYDYTHVPVCCTACTNFC